ncbi:DUF4012 domain-containing protein [Microbacterium sp.]|uniref:DUF4012 domain-containing protein n=1 Tax=Microbacterium sp. TaxID=51671 RepID=UPI003A9479B3
MPTTPVGTAGGDAEPFAVVSDEPSGLDVFAALHDDDAAAEDDAMARLQRDYEQLHGGRASAAGGSDGGDGDGGDVDGDAPKKKRRRWPWIVFSILVVLLILAGIGGVFLLQAMQVRDDLTQAKGKISQVVPLVKAGDTAGVKQTASDVLKLTSQADDIVSNPLWQFAAGVPFVGQNVAAVSETTKATHVLVRDAMPVALDLLATIDVKNLKVEGGGINLQPFRDIQPKLPQIKAAFDEAKTHVDKIDRKAILPFVDQNIGQLVDIVDKATPAIETVEKYLPDILAVMGDGGERTYALLFQNNAESRATGGNPGAGAILTVKDGHIAMREDRDVLRYYLAGRITGAKAIEPAETRGLFESDTAKHSQNFTRMPNFPDTARMFDDVWTDVSGNRLDGVISLDPVVLSHMLKVAGPMQIPGEKQQITADNAVQLLLFDTYQRFGADGAASDAYFAKVSAAVFKHIMGGNWDPMNMFEQLQLSAKEQRINLWFAKDSEQAMASDLGLDGTVAATNEKTTQLGIYINDASYSKLEYFLSTSMAVTCSAEKRTVTTSITLKSSVPSTQLNGWTLNWRHAKLGIDRRTMAFDVISMALPGGQLVATDPGNGDKKGWDRDGAINGRQAKSLFIEVKKGETRTVSFTSTVPDDAKQPLSVRYSPTVTDTPVTIDASCTGMFPVAK